MEIRSWLTRTALAVLVGGLFASQALADDSNYKVTTVASSGDVGRYTAMAQGKNGPVIAYYDKTHKAMKLAVCGDANCSAASVDVQTLYPHDVTDPGTTVDVAVKSDGTPVVVYLNKSDSSGDEIYYVECHNATCADPTVYSIGGVISDSADLAVTVNANDEAMVAYTYSDEVVYLLQCDAATEGCLTVGQALFLLTDYTSPRLLNLSLNQSDYPVIGLVADNGTDTALLVTSCTSAVCSNGESLRTVDAVTGTNSISQLAVAGAKNGTLNPVAVYYDTLAKALKVLTCDVDLCTSLSTETIYDGTATVKGLDLAVKSDGKPAVSFVVKSDDAYKLKLAQCKDVLCAEVGTKTIDSSASVGLYNSVTFISSKRAAISYYDSTNKDLKIAVKKKS